tara:strand:+ start:53580 stop:54557 length:978 start_codon:yes stop_codon:yes gene_type:complete
MNIILTGCAGFIGNKVCEDLLNSGNQIFGIDNLNSSYDINLKNYRLSNLNSNTNFNFFELDIYDYKSIEQTIFKKSGIKKIDIIINLAARAGVRQSVEKPLDYYHSNTIGTLNLLELCRRWDIPKFILASTSSVYGLNQNMPFSEDTNTDSVLSPYAASKKACEVLSHTYNYIHKIDISVLRFFTVYGPAGRPDMSIFKFIKSIDEKKPITIFGDGKQTRDFTFIDDIAKGVISSIKPIGFQIINLGNDKPTILSEVVKLIETYLNKKAIIKYTPAHTADVKHTWANINKAKNILNWNPSISIEEGIRKTVDWYLLNKSWLSKIK